MASYLSWLMEWVYTPAKSEPTLKIVNDLKNVKIIEDLRNAKSALGPAKAAAARYAPCALNKINLSNITIDQLEKIIKGLKKVERVEKNFYYTPETALMKELHAYFIKHSIVY